MKKKYILLLIILISAQAMKPASTNDNSKFHKVRKSISAVASSGFLGLTTGFFAKKIANQIINSLLNINQHDKWGQPNTIDNALLSPLLYTIFFVTWKCNENRLIRAFLNELESCDIHLNTELIERTWNLTSTSSFILSD